MNTSLAQLERLIHEVRRQKVMLDSDLARLYGVSTKVLNQAVKRNAERFPIDFVFRLTEGQLNDLRSQFVTSKGRGGRRYLPYVFTEHGAIMAATVLNSPRAVQMSLFVVRAFVKMRNVLTDTRELARKLAVLETELKQRLDIHDAAIVTILQRVMDLIDPPPPPPEPPKKSIGFYAKDGKGRYRVRPVIPTAFERRVYAVVARIPKGQTRSYQWVAQQLGNPSLARAVGGALSRNIDPAHVPCHRVIRANGSLGGYRWGAHKKRRLLRQEQRHSGKRN